MTTSVAAGFHPGLSSCPPIPGPFYLLSVSWYSPLSQGMVVAQSAAPLVAISLLTASGGKTTLSVGVQVHSNSSYTIVIGELCFFFWEEQA